ncbi:unnamed protein product [Thlaspi arvense]|uniref:Low-temperature-induced 65 kDa protein-like n=1 Tax=Thlaspi arvense TaxID=13288 RepID=A0AAU9SSK1_THLAR|nr:unnamed protein product [Thlaspi arvense]
MDMQSQMTRPYGHDQAEDPIRIHHPEEEEHQEKGATKVLKKVKEKAKKIKNSLTKHGHGHEHNYDVEEEDDEYDEQDPEVHGAPVYESSAVRGGVTGQPGETNVPAPDEVIPPGTQVFPGQPGETNVRAPVEIIPPGTRVFPVVSSDQTEPIEPEPLQEASYRHEAPSHPVRMSDREERREATTHPLGVPDLSDRGESREAHQMAMNTPVSLLSATEDVTRTFAPGEDEYLGGQRKVNVERPRGLEEDPAAPGRGADYLSGVSNYQTKVTDPSHKGGGEAGIPEIAESLGRMKVTDESHVKKSGRDFERDFPTRSHDFGLKNETGTGRDSPAGFGGESGGGIGKDFPTRSHEFDQKKDSGIDKNWQTVLTSGSIAGLGEDFPARSDDVKVETGFGRDLPTKGSHGYGEETGPGLEKNIPARYDDVKVETVLPTGSHDQFSPELSRPKERIDFDSSSEETRDETHESKPSTYTEKIGSATSFVADKAIAAKNAVASKLGYTGETTGAGGKLERPLGDETLKFSSGQHESPDVDKTPRSATGYGQKVARSVTEKLTPVYEKVKETGSNVMTKLPLSGGGSGTEETQQVEDKSVSPRNYLADKLRPGEEDKALSEVIAEKLHLGGGGEKKKTTTKEVEVTVEKIPSDQMSDERGHDVVIVEEGKGGGGGMMGKVKGAVTSLFGGSTEEVRPKSSVSGEESTQSLGSTVGTMGFSDPVGAISTQRGLQESGN